MTRRGVARIGLVLLAFGAGLLAQPSSLGAASVTKTAWWYRTSDVTSFIPGVAQPPVATPDEPIEPAAPPDVPEGSVLVQGTPEGATAIAALTYQLVEGESSPVLTITPSSSSGVPADAVILACRAAVDWVVPEAPPGRWQDKPLVDCGRSVNGIIGEDGTITFALGPLVSGPDLDVVLVPGTVASSPAGPVGSAFSLSFDTAEAATLATTTPTTSFASSPTTAAQPASSGSSFAAPSTGGSFTAPAPVVQPALEPQDQAPTVPSQPILAAPAAAPAEDETSRGVAFLILLAGAAMAALAYFTPARDSDHVGLGRFRRPVPASALATVSSEPVRGGLGRFARLRTAPPQHLS